MSNTIDELFYAAYRDAGLIAEEGTGLHSAQTEEARKIFNRMANSWALDGLKCWQVKRMVFNITSGKGRYSIGKGGDFDTQRPNDIERGSVIVVNQNPSPEWPLEKLTLQEWQEWRLKDLSITWPAAFYFDPELDVSGGAGNAVAYVNFLFVPGDSNQVALYLKQSLSPIDATGDTILDFADGYEEAIETNMAVTLAARRPGSNISPLTIQAAQRSLRQIKISNHRPVHMQSDYPVRPRALHDGWGNRRY